MSGLRPRTFRQWVIALFGAAGVGMLPWTVWLASSLQPHHLAVRWDIAWSGFDTGLALLFLATAVAAYKRSPWVGALSAALGMMLLTDAWFDIILESHADELRFSILLAVFAEVPAAGFCFWLAVRTERFLRLVVEEVDELHLPPARKGASESDLVSVLEVPPDGEAAREPGHTDAAT